LDKEIFNKGCEKILYIDIFSWFRTYGLPVILEYCNQDGILLEYEIMKEGIMVNITSKLILLTEMENDLDMWKVIQETSLISMKANEDGTITLGLWFV